MHILKTRFFKNTSWIIGGKVFQMAISLVISMLTARYLGPTNFGIINYVASYVAFFTSLCTLGLNGIIIKEFVANPDKQGNIIGSAIVLRLISSLISMIGIIALLSILNANDNLILVVAIIQAIALFFNSFDVINYWYQSKLQSKISTIVQSIAYVGMAIYRVIILILKKDILWFAFATTLDIMLIAVFLLIAYYKSKGPKLSFSLVTCKKLLSQSYHFILSGVMVAVYAQIDKIMIGQMLGITEVGLYSTAIIICGLWGFIPLAIIDSARPVIMEQKKINEEAYLKRLKQLYAVLIWLSIVYALFVTVFAKYIILILYGKEYLGAQSALIIAVWYCAFSYLGSAKNIWLICEGKQKYEKWFTLAGASCNVVLNFIFIPIFGIIGAAIATLITQIFTNIIMPCFFKGTRINTKYIGEAFMLKGVISKETIKNFFHKQKNNKGE